MALVLASVLFLQDAPSLLEHRLFAIGASFEKRDGKWAVRFPIDTDLSQFHDLWSEKIFSLDVQQCRNVDEFLETGRDRGTHLVRLKLTSSDVRLPPRHFRALRYLDLTLTEIQQFSFLKNLTNLESLNLTKTCFGDGDIQWLARLERLQSLDLSYGEISSVSFQQLASHPSLKELTLIDCGVTDRNCHLLGGSRTMKTLRLAYSNPFVGGVERSGISRLSIARLKKTGLEVVGGPTPKSREEVTVTLRGANGDVTQSVPIDDVGKLQEKVVSIELSGFHISDDDVASLLKQKSLERVTLSETRITDRSLRLLCRLPQLRYLDISETRISDLGFQENWTERTPLTELRARNTRITGVALTNELFPRLAEVNLGRLNPYWQSVRVYPSSSYRGIDVLMQLASLRSIEFTWTKHESLENCVLRLSQNGQLTEVEIRGVVLPMELRKLLPHQTGEVRPK